MGDGKERRQQFRFCHGNLNVYITHKYAWGLLHKKHVATWKDFNHTGMAFITECRFEIGQRLSLNLLMKDHNRAELHNVIAVVRNIHGLNNYYRYGVEFDFLSEEHMRQPQVKTILIQIEKALQSILSELESN